jgi:hypothetical protein
MAAVLKPVQPLQDNLREVSEMCEGALRAGVAACDLAGHQHALLHGTASTHAAPHAHVAAGGGQSPAAQDDGHAKPSSNDDSDDEDILDFEEQALSRHELGVALAARVVFSLWCDMLKGANSVLAGRVCLAA